jgi:hypothetical protein
MKTPRWRVIYETTGRLDVKFKGVKQLQVMAINLNSLKFKYLDESKTRIDLSDRTNKFLLKYSEKKHKASSAITPAASSMPMTSQQANRMDSIAHSSLSDHRIKQETMEEEQTKVAPRFTKVDDDLLQFLINKIKQRLEILPD